MAEPMLEFEQSVKKIELMLTEKDTNTSQKKLSSIKTQISYILSQIESHIEG